MNIQLFIKVAVGKEDALNVFFSLSLSSLPGELLRLPYIKGTLYLLT